MSEELRKALAAKSDRLNADDLMAGNMVIKITDVRVMLSASDGNIIINFEGDNGKPWKPSKGMGRALAAMWGDDERQWIGRSVELFREATVEYGGKEVGGIQICGASHIERDLIIMITKKRGQKTKIPVRKINVPASSAVQKPKQQPAPDDHDLGFDVASVSAALESAASNGMDALVAAWKATPKKARDMMGGSCPQDLKDTAAKADADRAAAAVQPETTEPNEEDIF